MCSRAQEETGVFEIDIVLKHNRKSYAAFLRDLSSYADVKELLTGSGALFHTDKRKQTDCAWCLKMTQYDDKCKLEQLNDILILCCCNCTKYSAVFYRERIDT
ncbi:unnamed protein product, partial [Didymodactylos carnosus]